MTNREDPYSRPWDTSVKKNNLADYKQRLADAGIQSGETISNYSVVENVLSYNEWQDYNRLILSEVNPSQFGPL